MKKVLFALLFLASTLGFSQDGRTKVNFYNQTSNSLRFMLNGNPACTGDVISGGACTESVNPGTYTASATNGQQTTGGQTFDIAYGETYNYTVSVQESYRVPSGVKLITVADLDYHKGFTVNAPVTLTTAGPTQEVTTQGKPYTGTMYTGSLPNDDVYFVNVAEYGFALVNADLDRVTDGFAGGINGTVTRRDSLTVSGFPAEASIVTASVDGKALRFALLTVIRGNTAYMFLFGTLLDTQSNMDDVKTFFTSVRLN